MTQANDWPLVFFTLFSQISVGILISGLLLWTWTKSSEVPSLEALKKILLISALAFMTVALILSFMHLASPTKALFAMSHASSSWLSREIILASVYLLSLLLSFTSLQLNFPHHKLFDQLFLASLILGVILIWVMAKVYMLPTVPLWNTPATPVAFFASSLILGGMSVMVIIAILSMGSRESLQAAEIFQRTLFYLVAVGVFAGLMNSLFLQADVSGLTVGFPLPEVASAWKNAQLAFLLAGFSLLTWWFAWVQPQEGSSSSLLIFLAAACLLIAEIAGRYLFYASYFRVGV